MRWRPTSPKGSAGRRWLGEQELPVDEREMLEACLRGIDFLDREVAAIDRALAELVLASAELRRLLTLPGVNVVAACVLLAAIGDIRRFPTARQLVGYLGLDPKVRQSGSEPARHGRISKQGRARRGTCWSKRPGTRRAAADRCAPSTSGSLLAAAATSPPSPSPASSSNASGPCCVADSATRSAISTGTRSHNGPRNN